jgi:carbonic anhydrase
MKKETLLADLASSLVVFFVALPLALGIAFASGAPSVLPGLISCAVGGIIVGILSGAPLQVSGPAAGLTVIVFDLINKFGWEVTCAITAGAGIVQILLARARLAQFCLGVSPAVVHGMLAGIGIVIALAQIHVVLGGDPQSAAWLNLTALPAQIMDIHGHSVFLGLLTIVLLAGWKFLPKVLSRIPAPLAAIVVTTIIANLLWLDVPRVSLPETLIPTLSLPQIPFENVWAMLGAIFTVAIVASIESLLCAVATDRLHHGDQANLDKELTAQGVGNFACGILGGLPITGVIIRSTANVRAGGKTRLSTIFHGLWIVLFVLFASSFLELIPLPALAGLLVHIGVGLVNGHHIRELHSHGELPVYVVTVLGVAFWNLLGGVFLGIGMALIMLLSRSSKSDIRVEEGVDRWHVSLSGSLSFLSVPRLRKKLSDIPLGVNVSITTKAHLMDHAVLDTIQTWQTAHEGRGGSVNFDKNPHV